MIVFKFSLEGKKASWLLASRQKVTVSGWIWVRGSQNGSFSPLFDSTGPPGEHHSEIEERGIKHDKNINNSQF